MGSSTETESTSVEFERQLAALAYLQTIDPDMSVLALRVLLAAFASPGITMVSLGEKLGAYSSTVSRIVSRLGKFGGQGAKEGLNLVATEELPEDRRVKVVNLTTKGRKVVERLQELLSE